MGRVRIDVLRGRELAQTPQGIVDMIDRDRISFENLVQRPYVWEVKRRSELIWSILMGYPVPPIFANYRDGVYDILDGQQRLTTVYKFLNGEFALSEMAPISYINEKDELCNIDISGMKYSDFPQLCKDEFSERQLTILYYDDMPQDQQQNMFRRLNNGKPLTTKARLISNCKDIKGMLDIGEHKLFDDMLTDRSRESKTQVVLAMKAWCMLNQKIEDISFETKKFAPILEAANISEAEAFEMAQVFDVAFNVHSVLIERKKKKIARKMYTETHFISLIPFLKNGMNESPELLADWISEFFDNDDGASKSEEYNQATTKSSAKGYNVSIRNQMLQESYEEFFAIEECGNAKQNETSELGEDENAQVAKLLQELHDWDQTYEGVMDTKIDYPEILRRKYIVEDLEKLGVKIE